MEVFLRQVKDGEATMITSVYAGLCGLLLVVLYVRVRQRRLATKIGMGTGVDQIYIHPFGVVLALERISFAELKGMCQSSKARSGCRIQSSDNPLVLGLHPSEPSQVM